MTETEQSVLTALDGQQELLFDTLSQLLRANSENFITHGNERQCTDILERLYRRIGLEPELYFPDCVPGLTAHPAYHPGRGTDLRPNLDVILPGRSGSGPVVVAAHTDTMPIGDESAWTVPPLSGLRKEGKIFGRGACDNKFGLAVSVMLATVFRELGLTFEKDLIFSAYCDEEYGGGNGALAATLRYPGAFFLNTDGGDNAILPCSIGGQGLRLTLRYAADTDTASMMLEAFATVRRHLEAFGQRNRERLHQNRYFSGTDMERSALRIISAAAGNGGVDLNTASVDFVYYTDQSLETVSGELARMQEELNADLAPLRVQAVSLSPFTRFFTCDTIPETDPAVVQLQGAFWEVHHRAPVISGACMSDLSIFSHYGKRALNFGILRDFMLHGGAHQPDEYVECAELLQYTKTIALFLLRYAGVSQEKGTQQAQTD